MKRLQVVAVVLIGLVPAACQRPASRTADASGSSPAPPAAAATPGAGRGARRPASLRGAPGERAAGCAARRAGAHGTRPRCGSCDA